MKIRRAAKADFLADRFEEECKRRGVNPEHPRLEGYVFMDGEVPRLAITMKSSIMAGGEVCRRNQFDRNQIGAAVDLMLSWIKNLERVDQYQREKEDITDRFRTEFKVTYSPGSSSFSIRPKSEDISHMSAEASCVFYGFRGGGEMGDLDVLDLKLRVRLPLEDAARLCEEALHNAKEQLAVR